MPLILTETALGDLVRSMHIRSNGALDDASCLDIIAASFGLPDPLALLSAVSDPPVRNEPSRQSLPPLPAFWQSGLLNSFITDYSCRRQPVVVILSGRDSIVVLSSAPQDIFEIAQHGDLIKVQSLGLGPWPKPPYTALGEYATPAQAFDALCQRNGWEWIHSTNAEVC